MITKFKLFENNNQEIFKLLSDNMLSDNKRLNVLKTYINSGGDINIIDKYNQNLLFYANNNYDFLLTLIKHNINMNQISNNDETILNFVSNSWNPLTTTFKLLVDNFDDKLVNYQSELSLNSTILIDIAQSVHYFFKIKHQQYYKNSKENLFYFISKKNPNWLLKNEINQTFIDYLNDETINIIKNKFPEKYEKYSRYINLNKFNI